MLDPEEHRAQQNREGAIPIGNAYLIEGAERTTDTGVIKGDIEAAELTDCAINCRLDIFLAGDVGFLKDGVTAVLFSFANDRLAAFLIEVGDYD